MPYGPGTSRAGMFFDMPPQRGAGHGGCGCGCMDQGGDGVGATSSDIARREAGYQHERATRRVLEHAQPDGGIAMHGGAHGGDPAAELRRMLDAQEGDGLRDSAKAHWEKHGDKYKKVGAVLGAAGLTAGAVAAAQNPEVQQRVATAREAAGTAAAVGNRALDGAQAVRDRNVGGIIDAAAGIRDEVREGRQHVDEQRRNAERNAAAAEQYPRAVQAPLPPRHELQDMQEAHNREQRQNVEAARSVAMSRCKAEARENNRTPMGKARASRKCDRQLGRGYEQDGGAKTRAQRAAEARQQTTRRQGGAEEPTLRVLCAAWERVFERPPAVDQLAAVQGTACGRWGGASGSSKEVFPGDGCDR